MQSHHINTPHQMEKQKILVKKPQEPQGNKHLTNY